jgi:hypothetical protein
MRLEPPKTPTEVIIAAITAVHMSRRHHPLTVEQQAASAKIDNILQRAGLDVERIASGEVLDVEAIRTSGVDVTALVADLKEALREM